MRSIQLNQLWLAPLRKELATARIPLLRELEEMSKVLDECGSMAEVYKRVRRDLVGDRRLDCGATGLSAEQALRAGIVKEKLGVTYRDLEFHLADSVALREFVKISELTRDYGRNALDKLKTYKAKSIVDGAIAEGTVQQLGHYLEITEKVLSQTIRRVINGESVPAKEKVVSIFEVHADIIKKGGRDTTFGHKVYLSSGKSGIVLDCEILKGNPPDHTLAKLLLERHKNFYGRAPEQIALDGGFASLEAHDILKKRSERGRVWEN